MEIRDKILFIMKKNKVSQREMAVIQEMSAGNVNQILQGKQNLSLNFILNLKKEFPSIDFNELLNEDKNDMETLLVSEEKTPYDKKISPQSAILEIKKILEKTQS